jgi:hypothetical protein
MRAALLATVLLALLAAGCGGDKAAAEATVSKAIRGLAKGDEQTVCDQLTAGAKRKLLATLAHNPLGFVDIRARTCEAGISKLYDKLSRPIRAVLTDGEVENTRITGDRAVVHVTGAGMDIELQKISDRWMITGGLFQK